jgi:hypothetical protein
MYNYLQEEKKKEKQLRKQLRICTTKEDYESKKQDQKLYNPSPYA